MATWRADGQTSWRQPRASRRQVVESCPRFFVTKKEYGGGDELEFMIKQVGTEHTVGSLYVTRDRGIFAVSNIEVSEQFRRCGLATRLYTVAAKEACSRGMPLQSDTTRSKYSQGFWEKQVAKGRARCIMTAKSDGPPRPDYDGPLYRRGDCEAFELRCPATDLSGRTRATSRGRSSTRKARRARAR
jgi:hypothetical protein